MTPRPSTQSQRTGARKSPPPSSATILLCESGSGPRKRTPTLDHPHAAGAPARAFARALPETDAEKH